MEWERRWQRRTERASWKWSALRIRAPHRRCRRLAKARKWPGMWRRMRRMVLTRTRWRSRRPKRMVGMQRSTMSSRTLSLSAPPRPNTAPPRRWRCRCTWTVTWMAKRMHLFRRLRRMPRVTMQRSPRGWTKPWQPQPRAAASPTMMKMSSGMTSPRSRRQRHRRRRRSPTCAMGTRAKLWICRQCLRRTTKAAEQSARASVP